ncbi:MAG: HAMP domain-containing protein [Moorea sp. SIO2B7]|nr:HAMP domain-containing protein [Moorena sp. SIO2B7]
MVTKFEPSSSTTETHSQNNESYQDSANNFPQLDIEALSSENSREENLDVAQVLSRPESPPKPASKVSKKTSLLQGFYDLPIGSKQQIIAVVSFVSVLALVITEGLIIHNHYQQVDMIAFLGEDFLRQLLMWGLVLGIHIGLAILVGNTIVKPVRQLEKIAKQFSQGDHLARAKVSSTDEVGQLAIAFNTLAENTLNSERALEDEASNLKQARRKAEELVAEQTKQNQAIQMELLQLLEDVEGASSGDLTVRADITEGQIGIVADFFNSIIESMRDIVTQVKQSTSQVNLSLGENEESMAELTKQSLRQAKKIQRMLDFVEQMAQSIQDVAKNASQAAEVARSASATATEGGEAMDRTVQSIVDLRETIGETAKKVKRLGESSQQISKVISLINQIALQTNLLAINASIEAARAGEEGRGFAVVAEEVGQLAAQSAAATKEIEQIVENIQLETSQVVEAMELGTTQVVEGTHLVEEAKQSLGRIVEVSRQIDQLVESISSETVSQTQTSEMVTNLMKDIAKVSEGNSDSSRQVSNSIQETVNLAKQLQASVETFKVADQS